MLCILHMRVCFTKICTSPQTTEKYKLSTTQEENIIYTELSFKKHVKIKKSVGNYLSC